jgi:hypothetical protein
LETFATPQFRWTATIRSMTPADAQQQRLLERLRPAGDQPVAFADLHAGGIAVPAAVVSELELNGYVIARVRLGGGLGLCRAVACEPREHVRSARAGAQPSGWTYDVGPMASALRERGWKVLVPDLSGSLTGGPPFWSRQVDTITDTAAGQAVILVGHSGAGPLLAAAVEALDRVQSYLFVGAGLPFPEQSWMDTAPPELVDQLRAMAVDGWLPRWSE